MALQIKKGDTVKVLTGKDKGKTGVVLACDPKNGTLVVDGVNVVTKHVKPRSAQQTGGIVKENGKIDASNVQIVCPACGKATRIGAKTEGEKKVRVCKHCGAALEFKTEEKKAEKPAKKTVRKKSAKTENVEAVAEEKPVKKTVRKKSAKTAEEAAE